MKPRRAEVTALRLVVRRCVRRCEREKRAGARVLNIVAQSKTLPVFREKREARIAKGEEIRRVLDAAGLNGFTLVQEYREALDEESAAHFDLTLDESAVLQDEWKRMTAQLLGKEVAG